MYSYVIALFLVCDCSLFKIYGTIIGLYTVLYFVFYINSFKRVRRKIQIATWASMNDPNIHV